MIRAEAHSDDHNVEIEVDATAWFQQATDAEILELADCEWGGDYPADGVAEFCSDGDTKRLFDYLAIIQGDRSKKDCGGFECHVNDADALAWLKENRSYLFQKLVQKPV
jgi:hypothetical protein